MAFVCLMTIGFTSCETEKVEANWIDSMERVDPNVIAAKLDLEIASGFYTKEGIKSLEAAKTNLFSSNVSRAGNSEIICDNNSGWISINNNTGDMMLHVYGSSPSGIISNPCDMDCAMGHCFNEQ